MPQPPAATPIEQLLQPFLLFFRTSAAGGILLLASALAALVWANSPWSQGYHDFWHATVTVSLGEFTLSGSLQHWINDGLMAVFFFVVGLEIKREVLVGELTTLRQAALPAAAALGGMLAPAALYAALNLGRESLAGWGIPMATDIAFALGLLSLLGSRAPLALKVFLTALAIADDLGAVLVIALFYTAQVSWAWLGLGALFFGLLLLANRLGVRYPLVFFLLSLGLWLAFLYSGVHATVAGVLAALAIPASRRSDPENFLANLRWLTGRFEACVEENGVCILRNHEQHANLQAMHGLILSAEPPLQRLEHGLHPWVSFAIMPVFALANAGVPLGGDLGASLGHPAALGVIVGLVLGKPAGVMLFSWLAVRLGWASLPGGVSWRQMLGAGCLAGIGFTMSIFIAGLAFGRAELLNLAKTGVLAASLAAGLLGWLLLSAAPAGGGGRERPPSGAG
ncbi:Na(+)/H(+) antiporter NhaA [Desulfocarbo indianensis]|nr:Na(+)/H(+) antiporter NhaA [Desulfocarbo indianensis]